MMFDAEYSNQTKNFLRKADKVLSERLIKKIESLQEKPIIHDTKSVEGYAEKLYRVRAGDYRILYEVDYKNKRLGIVKIDKRSRVF